MLNFHLEIQWIWGIGHLILWHLIPNAVFFIDNLYAQQHSMIQHQLFFIFRRIFKMYTMVRNWTIWKFYCSDYDILNLMHFHPHLHYCISWGVSYHWIGQDVCLNICLPSCALRFPGVWEWNEEGVLTFVTCLSGIVQWCPSLNVLGVGGDPHIQENTDTLAVAHGCRPMKWSSVRQQMESPWLSVLCLHTVNVLHLAVYSI